MVSKIINSIERWMKNAVYESNFYIKKKYIEICQIDVFPNGSAEQVMISNASVVVLLKVGTVTQTNLNCMIRTIYIHLFRFIFLVGNKKS